jgi:transcription initiation factor TFIID subunit 1
MQRDKNGQSYWTKKDSLLEPPESELKKLVAPEHVNFSFGFISLVYTPLCFPLSKVALNGKMHNILYFVVLGMFL